MTINEIILILNNRLLTLNQARQQAVLTGDLEQVIRIDSDITSTETSINQLNAIG